MNKLKLFSIALLLIGTIGFTGCTDDTVTPTPEPIDPTVQLKGTFSVRATTYDLDDNSVLDVVTGEMTVAQSNIATDRIDFYFDGELLFYGDKTALVDNGVVFDVPKQVDASDPDDIYDFEGADGYTVNGTKYDGFSESTKKILCELVFTSQDDGWQFLMELELTK